MALDAQLYKANLEAARTLIDNGQPDGGTTRLKAHGVVLRDASFGVMGDSAKLEYIAGALADICLAVTDDCRVCEQLLAMADVFESKAGTVALEKQGAWVSVSAAWSEAAGHAATRCRRRK